MDCTLDRIHAGRMTSAALGLMIVLGAFLVLDVIAWRWGADTRVGREWQWREHREDCDD